MASQGHSELDGLPASYQGSDNLVASGRDDLADAEVRQCWEVAAAKKTPNQRFRDQTCQKHGNDSSRDWRWPRRDGIMQGWDHVVVDWRPRLGVCSVETDGWPLLIAFVRQSFGSLDVLKQRRIAMHY